MNDQLQGLLILCAMLAALAIIAKIGGGMGPKKPIASKPQPVVYKLPEPQRMAYAAAHRCEKHLRTGIKNYRLVVVDGNCDVCNWEKKKK
jgi:hypothetical protein